MLVVGLLGCCFGCFTKTRGPFHILAVAVDTVACICNGGFGGGGNDACRWVVGLLFLLLRLLLLLVLFLSVLGFYW